MKTLSTFCLMSPLSEGVKAILCFNVANDTKQDWVLVKLDQNKKSHYLIPKQSSYALKNSIFQK